MGLPGRRGQTGDTPSAPPPGSAGWTWVALTGGGLAFGAGATHFSSIEALLPTLLPMLLPQTTVLVKGSRFMRMERVVEALRPANSDSSERNTNAA